jgi:alkylation response protein AidB-like acyl-CoA dehydrogenase
MNTNILGRIGIAAQMVGLAQVASNKAVPYTYERKQLRTTSGHLPGHGVPDCAGCDRT